MYLKYVFSVPKLIVTILTQYLILKDKRQNAEQVGPQ